MLTGKHGFRPIHRVATYNSNPAIIRKLVDVRPEIHKEKALGSPPLHWAAQHNESLAVIQVLISAGADINAKTEPVYRLDEKFYGNTALHFAANSNGNFAVIKELIKAGADINAQNDDGKTPHDFFHNRFKDILEINALLNSTP